MSLSDTFLNADCKNRGMKTKANAPGGGHRAPADQQVGPIGYEVATRAKRLAPNLKVVKADQHYTRKKETFVRPLREQGWEIVMRTP